LPRASESMVAVGGTAVGDEDEQRTATWVADRGDPEHLRGLEQPFGQWRAPTGWQRLQPSYGGLHAAGRRQGDRGSGAGERDQADGVATLVGIQQERDDRGLHL